MPTDNVSSLVFHISLWVSFNCDCKPGSKCIGFIWKILFLPIWKEFRRLWIVSFRMKLKQALEVNEFWHACFCPDYKSFARVYTISETTKKSGAYVSGFTKRLNWTELYFSWDKSIVLLKESNFRLGFKSCNSLRAETLSNSIFTPFLSS